MPLSKRRRSGERNSIQAERTARGGIIAGNIQGSVGEIGVALPSELISATERLHLALDHRQLRV